MFAHQGMCLKIPCDSLLGQSYMDTSILTSLLVLMGISTFTSKELVIFCRVSVRLAMVIAMFNRIILGQ